MKFFDFSRFHPLGQLLVLSIFVVAGLFASWFLTILVAFLIYGNDFLSAMVFSATSFDNTLFLKFTQGLIQFGAMLAPPLLFAYFYGKEKFKILRLYPIKKYLPIGCALLMPFIILPLISLLSEWNAGIKLPECMAAFENYVWEMEKSAEALTNAFLKVDTVGGFAINILVMAFIPAIAEEFLFRGCIQQILHQWFRHIHWAILVTAIIFSAVHGQFFGFFPRLALGIMLGYLMITTNSIWTSVLAHFVNNATIVLIAFLTEKKLTSTSFETFGKLDNSVLAGAGSAAVTVLLFYLLWRRKNRD